jgi:PKD repeat protein
VTATDPIGQEASDSASIEVLPLPPHASIATPAPDATDPLTINFDASASTGTELTYHWDYGDGVNEDAEATTSHSYTGSGTYTVRLTVTDVANQTDSISAPVTIQVAGPVARFTSSQTYYDPYYPYACYDFDASSSTGYNLSYSSFSWSFGDGSGSTGQTTSNCFYGGGSYAVWLQVTDALGQTSAITHYVPV